MEIKLVGTKVLSPSLVTVLVYACGDTQSIDWPETPKGKWGGNDAPPAKGTRVHVSGFGEGTVLDYFVQDGWLGIIVLADNPPEWSIKLHGRLRVFSFFGVSVE